MPDRNLTEWDFKRQHVQDLGTMNNLISAESIVVLAGPKKLPPTTADLIPIGLVENATVTQNKQLQQLFEIGSRQPFFIPGRTFTNVGLSRVLFDGKSLLRAIYQNNSLSDDAWDEWPVLDTSIADELPGDPYDSTSGEGNTSSEFYINLASSFFNLPLGLGFVIKDQEEENYGGFYLEECYVQNHQFSLAANQTIVLENAGLKAARVVPIDYTS
jgi:hypothetical protein|tara:strand:- start:279 stop:923 length:645 start_codon:yes stop_codon:yes gene_type:complete